MIVTTSEGMAMTIIQAPTARPSIAIEPARRMGHQLQGLKRPSKCASLILCLTNTLIIN